MRRLALGLLSTLVALVGLAGCSTRQPYKPVSFTGAYEAYPSGMRLLVQEASQAPLVTLHVSYRVGAADEPVGKEGLAFLASRLTFLARQGGGAVSRLDGQFLAVGAAFSAEVGSDDTGYESIASADRLPRLLAIEAQRMRDPLMGITEADFAQVRDDLAAQVRIGWKQGSMLAELHLLRESLLPGHPYGHMPVGHPEALKRLTLEDVRAFVKANYTPAHAVLVVSGPLPAVEVKFEVARAFVGLTGAGSATRTPPVVQLLPSPTAPLKELPGLPHVRRTGPVAAPQLWVTWKVPGTRSGKQFQSRLVTRFLRPELQWGLRGERRVRDIQVFDWEHSDLTLLTAKLELEQEADAPEVAKKVIDYVARMEDSRWHGWYYAPALKAEVYSEFYRELDRTPVQEMARTLRATGQPTYLAWRQRQTEKGLKELEHYVRANLGPGAAWTMLVVPEWRGGQVALPAWEEKALIDGLTPLLEWRYLAPPGVDVRRALRAPGLADAERFTLANGLKVVVDRRAGVPLVEARLLLPGHPAGTTDRSSALLEGLMRNPQLTQFHADWGLLTQKTEPDHAVVGASAVSANFLPVLRHLGNRGPPRALSNRYPIDHQTVLAHFEALSKQPERHAKLLAQQALAARLFPGHVHGSFTKEELEKLPRAVLERWSDTRVRPERSTLVLVGELPPRQELMEQLEEYFGDWESSELADAATVESPMPRARSVVVVDTPGKPFARVEVGVRGPALDGAREATAEVFVSVLDQRLRTLPGTGAGVEAAPSIHTRHELLPHAAVLRIESLVRLQNVAEVLSRCFTELGALKQQPPPGKDVEQARWQLAHRYARSFRSSADVADQLAYLELRGRTADYWEKYPEHLAAVTPESLQALMGGFGTGAEAVVITGDASLLQPQLRLAGYQVEVVTVPKMP